MEEEPIDDESEEDIEEESNEISNEISNDEEIIEDSEDQEVPEDLEDPEDPEEISDEPLEESSEDSIDETIPEDLEENPEMDLEGEPSLTPLESDTIENAEELLDEAVLDEELPEDMELSEEEEQARMEREIRDFHKCQIEAALYAAGKPLDAEELSAKLEIKKKEAGELLMELAFDYLERSTALVIAQIGERYQMQIKPEYTEKVSKFASGGAIAEKYLRTLTIIALKQPLLKSMVIKLRGTGAYEHVKYLLENGLISAVKKGRSHELTTTDKYAEMFGLPKDREAMKRTMIAQLGLEPDGNPE